MKSRLQILVYALCLVVGAEAIAIACLIRTQANRRDEIASVNHKRDEFCVAYHGMLELAQLELSHHDKQSVVDNHALYARFRSLASSPYFDLCNVDVASVDGRVRKADACFDANDFPCVAEAAADVVRAVPMHP